jgi:hypothetical protein
MKGFRLFVILLSWHPDATRFVLPLTRKAGFWLASPYREGVEPSGPLRKVSAHTIILLSCPPDATSMASVPDPITLANTVGAESTDAPERAGPLRRSDEEGYSAPCIVEPSG